MTNLGGKLFRRYEITYILEDLQEAIRITEEFIEIRAAAGNGKPFFNLGRQYHAMYEHTGNADDLDSAIAWFIVASELNGAPHSNASMQEENVQDF